MHNKLIFTSYGLTTKVGKKLIAKELSTYDLSDKRIFLFHEPHNHIETILVEVCEDIGFKKENIILSGQQKNMQEVLECDFYYCTEGNTYEVLSLLRERGLVSVIREGFKQGDKVYIGCSAGAAIAGVTIEEIGDMDKNFVKMTDFESLGLFDGIIIPHYTKKELIRFIRYSPGIADRYRMILSVANTRSLVLEV